MRNNEVTIESISKVVRLIVQEEVQPIKDAAKQFRSDILTSQGSIMKELKTIREEQIAGVYRDDMQNKNINNIQGRVTLEQQAIN